MLRTKVRVGGQEAEVLYAGSAPLLVSGAMQINVKAGAAVLIELILGDTDESGWRHRRG